MALTIFVTIGDRTLFNSFSNLVYALPTIRLVLDIANLRLRVEVTPEDIEPQRPTYPEPLGPLIPVYTQTFNEFGIPIPNPDPLPAPAPEQILLVPPPGFDYEAQQFTYELL